MSPFALRLADDIYAQNTMTIQTTLSPLKREVYTRPKASERQSQMEVQVENAIVLSVGDWHHLGGGKDRIAYAGMPSEKVFSVVVRRGPFMYQGYVWNLFFPKGQREIRIDGVNLLVESVTPEQIVLRG